jgi:hypothetical protein
MFEAILMKVYLLKSEYKVSQDFLKTTKGETFRGPLSIINTSEIFRVYL